MSGSLSSWQKAWYRGLKAVDRGDIKTLQDLWFQYDHKILDSLPDESGTLLHYAALKSKPKVVAFLLKNGADPNVRDLEGETPLFWAATIAKVCTRTTEGIRLLVKYGADLNMQDYHGCCVLTLAVVRSGAIEDIRRKRIELLLEVGADPRVRCWDGLAPIDYMGQSIDGGHWTYSLPDNAKERKRSEVLLRAEMNRRDVKMLLLVARRRLQKNMEEGTTVGGSATAAPGRELVVAAATGGSSDDPRRTKRSRRSSQEEGKEEEGQEEEGQEEEQQHDVPIVEVARRLVHLQDSIMFELCMNCV